MFAGVDDVVNALDFIACRAPVVDAQAFGNDVVYGHGPGRAAIRAHLVRFNELQILAQNAFYSLFSNNGKKRYIFSRKLLVFSA